MSGKTIVMTSGKGGVGKTTATANVGAGLALRSNRVVVVDTDIGLRNLDIVMGLENRIVYDLVDVVEERCRIEQALIRDKHAGELYLIAAAQTGTRIVCRRSSWSTCAGVWRWISITWWWTAPPELNRDSATPSPLPGRPWWSPRRRCLPFAMRIA